MDRAGCEVDSTIGRVGESDCSQGRVTVKIETADCHDPDRACSLEWLEVNGLGGFASGTIAGANTRRYHALLLTACAPSTGRYVLVNHLEEWLILDQEAVSISTNVYPGVVYPDGFTRCLSYSSSPWPTWCFTAKGYTVQREILCVQGRDLVIVRWKLRNGPTDHVVLRVRPMLTGREYHGLHHENGVLCQQATLFTGQVIWQPYQSLPSVRAFHTGRYRHAPDWYRQLEFPVEQQRGLDSHEDWWTPGEFCFDLKRGTHHSLVFATEPIERIRVQALMSTERRRRRGVPGASHRADRLAQTLRQASEAFLVQRGARQTVMAGYPWFTDWGRDTFISLPGLCLVTGRYQAAWHIIESFAAHVSDGMIPNRFPDRGETPEYNTMDASLWFIHALDRYMAYSQQTTTVRSIAWPVVKQILDGYRRGTRFNIHLDHDGLITGGVAGVQLTWMDAKIGEWVVTPRHGKPVEIQALWIRALEAGERLAKRFGESDYAAGCRMDRIRAVDSFRRRFWYDTGGYLYDVIDGPEGPDPTLRPNQIYALALCDDLVTDEQAKQMLRLIKDQLLTPVGLRTLAPTDHRYRGRYEGGVTDRDRAYHQGTVWPFLLGPFVTAWVKTFGDTPTVRAEARTFLDGLDLHVQEACVGQVSEIFDGDVPHHPRGCPAQAWSVAEPLRAMVEDLKISV